MKASSKSPKFPVIESLLVLVVIGLVGFVAWYVWDAKQNTDKILDQANESSSQSAQPQIDDLTVATSKLPAGWSIDNSDKSQVTLRNSATQCFGTVVYTKDPASLKATVAEAQKENLEAIQSKGYTVKELGRVNPVVMTTDGTKQVNGQVYRVTLDGNTLFQNYGFVTTNQQQLSTQASCPTQTDLTGAVEALQAVTVNHKL